VSLSSRPSTLRRPVVTSSLLALLLAIGAWFGPRWAERHIRARIESEAARRGLRAEIREVQVGLLPPLAVSGLRIEKPSDVQPVLREAQRIAGTGRPVLVNAWLAKTAFRKGSISI